MRKLWVGVAAATFAVTLIVACGFDSTPLFAGGEEPEQPASFYRGRLGLLTPSLQKEYELAAFRLLQGLPLDRPPETQREPAPETSSDPRGVWLWVKVRNAAAHAAAVQFVSTYRSWGGQYVNFENCLSDAFEVAAQTLQERRKQYGSDADVQAWIAAQDQVFQNCGGDKLQIPAEPAASARALQKADRRYQIAAAYFYGLDFDGAEKRFRAISQDTASPWHQVAPYLIGRTLLRKATLGNDGAALESARKQFALVAGSGLNGPYAEVASRMVEHLAARQQPREAMERISQQLLAERAAPPALEKAIGEAAFALRAPSFEKSLKEPELPEAFDWVRTFEDGNEEHAVAQWRARRSAPWLTVALMYAKGTDPEAKNLIAAAERLPEPSPAYDTATYNAIRLRIERHETEQTAATLERLMKRPDQPTSLLNGWRAERMRVAVSFSDLLRWAPRQMVAGTDESAVLADDSAFLLNFRTPLARWKEAALSGQLPEWSAADVALAGWTRAYALEDWKTARELAPAVAKAHPRWAKQLIPAEGVGLERWRFEAALLIASHHEFQPTVRVSARESLNEGSWWCPVVPPAEGKTEAAFEENAVSWRLPSVFDPPPAVLSDGDKQKARQEVEKLQSKGSTQALLAPIVFNWAKVHPEDASVPQALHRLVVVTRYGCSNDGPASGALSKQAFEILHRRYPNNRWTERTPYWFP